MTRATMRDPLSEQHANAVIAVLCDLARTGHDANVLKTTRVVLEREIRALTQTRPSTPRATR